MDIRPTADKDVFEVWLSGRCAVYWKAGNGEWWVMRGTFSEWRYRMNNGAAVDGELLSAQVMAMSLLETT